MSICSGSTIAGTGARSARTLAFHSAGGNSFFRSAIRRA
jgi:hypothetical protein